MNIFRRAWLAYVQPLAGSAFALLLNLQVLSWISVKKNSKKWKYDDFDFRSSPNNLCGRQLGANLKGYVNKYEVRPWKLES